jgi:chlorobactene glucosyltransferase
MLAAAAALVNETLEKEPLIFLTVLNMLVALFLLVLLVIAISNLFVLRSLKDYKKCRQQSFVSVLIPARNEEEGIGSCVKSLLAQDYPHYEVLVLDDDSSDGTWQILESLAASNSRLNIGKGTPLPQGWLGKHWACHQLSLKAQGDLLLFTDADTIHRPSMLKHAVAAMEAEKTDLISALPKQVMPSFLEKLIMPFSYWGIISFLPLTIAYRNQNILFSAATGQFMLFKTSSYRQIGGFEAVGQHVVDDIELCKRVRSHGLRWRLLDGRSGYRVRQYKNCRELFEGYTKNLFAGFGNNAAAYISIWLWLTAVFWLPLISLTLGLVNNDTLNFLTWLGAGGIMVSLATWFIACARFGFPLYLPFFYPAIILIMTSMAMSSMAMNLSRKATWKGRLMPGSK